MLLLNIGLKCLVQNLRHAVSKLRLQGQGSQKQSRVLVAAQPVLQKVSSELEVILVAGLFVPVRERNTYSRGDSSLGEDGLADAYKRRETSLTKNLTRK